MRFLSRIGRRFRSLLRRERLDAELSEELLFHIERQVSENIAAGMAPEDARSAAFRELHGIEQIKEECRDMRRTRWLETILQDARFGVRTFRRRPGFTLCVLSILAFGAGSSTAIFSVVNGVLLTALPYRAPQNLVRIFGTWEHGSREGISPPDFLDYRQRNSSFESIAAASVSTPLLNLKALGDPEQIRSRNVTAGFFSTLGIQPLFGREFRREDEAWKGPAVAILSYGLWQRQYGGNPSVVGGALTINGVSFTIAGILPSFFNFLGPSDIFTPVQHNPAPGMRSVRNLIMVGRLKPGFDLRRAQSELDAIALGLREQYPQFDHAWSATAAPLTEEVVKDVKPGLVMLVGAMGLFILLVSVSIASLMLSYATSRRAEISVRIALGASRPRVMRQLFTESLTLALAGGTIGCVLGYWGLQLIKRFGPVNIPRLAEAAIDLRVLAFTLAVSVIVGLAFGLEPALRAGRSGLAENLKAGGRTLTKRMGLRDVLVVAEVAISVVLLIGAGLLIRSLFRLENVDPGFQTANVLTTRIALPGSKYSDGTGAKMTAFWRDAVKRIEAIPGVDCAALTSELPLSGLNNPTPRMATTSEGKSHLLYLRSVSPNYPNVMRIPMRAGRFLSQDDRNAGPRVVVINEQFRKDLFGDRDPIGQRLTFDFHERQETGNYQAVIVGVVGDIRHTSLASPPFREAYIPLDQSPLSSYDLVVRTKVNPKAIAGGVRQSIWSLDRDESLGSMRTVEEVVDLGLMQPRFRGYVLGGFAAMAVILSAAGLYGLLSFLVSLHTREIGIRMALGAPPRDILGQVLGKGVGLTMVGLCIGVPLAFGVARFLSTLVYGIGFADPLTFVVGATLLLVVAFVASYLPARRAMNLNPVDVLRSE
jgi:predicted permease